MDGDHLVPAVEACPGELVPDVDAQAAALPEDTKTFLPHEKKIFEIVMKGLSEADLFLDPVILDVPVGWGSDNEGDTGILEFGHGPAVPDDDPGCG